MAWDHANAARANKRARYHVRFRKYSCYVVWGRYPNGRLAIQLKDGYDGQLVAVATVNLPDSDAFLGPNQVFLKDWSENEGVIQALELAGIVKTTGEDVPTGFVRAKVADVLVEPDL